jgi:hypothetical protein
LRRAWIAAIAFAVAVPLLLLGRAPLAHAATSCYASGCNGTPAASTTCVNDAYVAEQVNILDPNDGTTVIGNVQLKYSPSCRATWARVIQNIASFSYDAAWAKVISTGSAPTQSCTGSGAAGTGCNTDMMDDLNPLKSVAQGAAPGRNFAFNSATTSPPF